jgi:branched-chain amino acid transport system substrate-binding protein
MSSADDLTQRKESPLIVRTNMTSSQMNMPFGEYAAKTLGYKRIAIITQDYAYGWESAGGFQYAFEKSGGQIVKKIFVPLGAPDWAPYVRQLPRNVDAVFGLPVGGGVAPFVRAYHDAGLWGKIPLIGGPDLGDEDALQAIGKEEIGVVHVHDYNPNNPETQDFAKAFEDATGTVPSYWGASTYVAMMWIDKVIKAYRDQTGASADDTIKWIRDKPTEFIAKFRDVPLDDAPWGPSKMDDHNNAILNGYVIKIIEKNGKPFRKTIKTIPDVSQFWTVPPEQFLKQPVFSRSFPK